MQRGSPCRRMPTSRTQPSGHRIASCNFRAAGNTNRNEGRSAGKIEKSKIVRGKGRKKMHNRGRNDRGTTVIKRPTRTSQIKAHRDDARDREKKVVSRMHYMLGISAEGKATRKTDHNYDWCEACCCRPACGRYCPPRCTYPYASCVASTGMPGM